MVTTEQEISYTSLIFQFSTSLDIGTVFLVIILLYYFKKENVYFPESNNF